MKPFGGLAAAVPATLLLDGALAATSGTFNILAMNVAGLPAILNDNGVPGDKADNAAAIGAKLAEYGYDVVQLQEVGLPGACCVWHEGERLAADGTPGDTP